MQADKLLTIGELAALLQISKVSVNELRKNGDGPREVRLGERTIRFRVSDVQEWLTEHAREAGATELGNAA
ncbi:helix-turn-helix transcriptional regulator [Corynebacterium gallinarum]|uniref:Helix-turn-helix domain-containing protein n=1 Tax=Corynebacterium gallinarum TaxID=2762214 RepID=A0A8I0HHU1_9CORY|nr:helix-turn-helix domain-containing protein [Corynebacterium gallinarum]MBD8030283.1 helix-turn-helix domain-containing protein [Corynebacterium gallinarum]